MPNPLEEHVQQKLELDGWLVFKRGWPDFLCVRTKDGRIELQAIEVKSGGSKPTEEQHIILSLLAGYFPTFLVTEEGVTRSHCYTRTEPYKSDPKIVELAHA